MAAAAVAAICADAARLGLAVSGSQLTVPVFSTADGSDLRALGQADIIPAMVSMQAVECMDFRAAMKGAPALPVTRDSAGLSVLFTEVLLSFTTFH